MVTGASDINEIETTGAGKFRRRAGEALLGAVDKAVTARWEDARRRASATTASTVDGRVQEVIGAFRGELATAGALTGGIAAVPGIGTATAIATAVGELSWITVRLCDMILTIAVLHGHDQASVEERRVWVLSVLAFGESAAGGFTQVAREAGMGLGRRAVKGIPTSALRSINRALGRTIVTKYGTKRGAVALGRALPFGIGAAIGAGANYATIGAVGGHADRFFRQLPYSDSD